MTEFRPDSDISSLRPRVTGLYSRSDTRRRQFDILAERSPPTCEQAIKFGLIDITNRWRFTYSNALPAGGWSISDV
jgi:hypothetical protein